MTTSHFFPRSPKSPALQEFFVNKFVLECRVAEDRLAYKDLREFITMLEKEGELRRIAAEVDPILEITEITDRVTRAGGPALLFERPKGSRVPLLINMLGSERRMNLALEVSHVDEVAARIRGFLDMQSPQGLLDKIKMLPKLAELGSFFPKSVKTGPCKEVIRRENFSLLEFPVLQCWPKDAGRFITWPLVITRNPETGKRNVGVYRMQVYDERTTGMHWQTQKHGAEHFRRARAARPDGRIDVAVAIGSDPMTCLSGILPIPPDLDELMFAGFLRRSRWKWSRAKPAIWRYRPTPKSFSKVTSTWRKCARKDLSAITPGFTRSKAISPCSM